MKKLLVLLFFAFFFLPLIAAQFPYFSPEQILQEESVRIALLFLFFFAVIFFVAKRIFPMRIIAATIAGVASIFMTVGALQYFDVLLKEKIVILAVAIVAVLGIITIFRFMKRMGFKGIIWFVVVLYALFWLIPEEWRRLIPVGIRTFIYSATAKIIGGILFLIGLLLVLFGLAKGRRERGGRRPIPPRAVTPPQIIFPEERWERRERRPAEKIIPQLPYKTKALPYISKEEWERREKQKKQK